MFGLGTGTFTANWSGGTGPYDVSWNFGGAATNPAAANNVVGTTNSQTVTFVDLASEQTFQVTVTVTDSLGISGSATANITVGPTQNAAPTISATVSGSTITVTVADADGDNVTVTAGTPTGAVTISPATQTVTGGNGSVDFTFSATDFFAGATGASVDFTADDGNGGTATATASPLNAAGLDVADNTLLDVPTSNSTTVGSSVTHIVATGALPNPFKQATGVSIIFPAGTDYTADSFGWGIPDDPSDPQDAEDGIWTLVGATPAGQPDDPFIVPFTSTGGDTYYQFVCVPLGGANVAANTEFVGGEQAVLNYGVTYSATGSFEQTFLDQDGGNDTTYYQATGDTTNRLWGSHTQTGVNSVVDVT
jgi:hypothetical protein